MIKKKFYTHLVSTEELIIKLDKLDLSSDEKIHLVTVVDSSVHAVVIDLILSEIKSEDKKRFLNFYQDEDHDLIWIFLHEKVYNIEEKISDSAKRVLKDFEKDIDNLLKK